MMPRSLLLNHRITFASSSMYFVAVSDQQKQHAVSQPPGRQDKQSCHQPTAQILPVTLVFVLDSITLSPETTRQVHVARYGKWGQTQVRLRVQIYTTTTIHHPSQTNPPTSPQSQLGIPWRRTDVRGLSLVPKIGDSNRCIRCNGKTLQCKRALEI